MLNTPRTHSTRIWHAGGYVRTGFAATEYHEHTQEDQFSEVQQDDSCHGFETLCPVVKVFATHAAPSFASPWKTCTQWFNVGSAFPIKNQLLLTNAHIVEDTHLIHVRRGDDHRKVVARVVCLCFECDLALLSVDEQSFWKGLDPVVFAEGLPSLQSEVCVIGFPDAPSGGDTVCVTKGVVSRIDLQSYSWDSKLLVVQIDAAINPGNSGGPCVDQISGCVVGVAFQKGVGDNQESIGCIIPIPVVTRFFECHRTSTWGFGAPGFSWQLLDNPSLRELVGLPEGLTGVLVSMTSHTAPAHKLLEPMHDILLDVDGDAVGEDGTMLFRENTIGGHKSSGLRLKLQWAFRRRAPGEKIKLNVMRGGVQRTVLLPLCRVTPLVPADPLDSERLGTQPEYLLVAGLVFIPLTEPYLTEEYGEDWSNCPARLEFVAQHGRKLEPNHQVVILSDVLACEFTQGYEIYRRHPVLRCDGTPIKHLAHLASLVSECKEPFFAI